VSKSWKGINFQGIDQTVAELIQAGGKTFVLRFTSFRSILNKKEFPQQWKESVTVSTKRVIKLTTVVIKEYHCY